MTIAFQGGPVDGAAVEVPDDSGWDTVELIGISKNNVVVAGYRSTQLACAECGTLEFEYDPEATLNPGETVRVVTLEQVT